MIDVTLKHEDKERLASTLLTWCNQNSGSYHLEGLRHQAQLIKEAFHVLKAEALHQILEPYDDIDDRGEQRKNAVGELLHFRQRSQAPYQILLCGHYDTVYGANSDFQKAHRDGDVVYGPGAADMKAGLLIMLSALQHIEQSSFREQLGWQVVLTPDEEIGSPSSKVHLETLAKQVHAGLIFEPTLDAEGTMVEARGGSGKFVVLVRGKAAHVGRSFEHGRSAIVALSKIVCAVDSLNTADVVANTGLIHGGQAVNVVADFAMARLDIRVAVHASPVRLKETMTKICSDVQLETGCQCELHGDFFRAAKWLNPQQRDLQAIVNQAAQASHQTIAWKRTGGVCDGNTLFGAGLANIDTLGACGGYIHSPDEYMLLSSMFERIVLTTHVIERLVEERFDGRF